MVKQTDEAVEKQLVTDPQTGEPAKPLYGNENYVSDHRPRARSENPPTAAEWLAEAKEAEAVLTRGDHVSPELVERLFLDAVPVIENAAGGTTEPTSKKREREEK